MARSGRNTVISLLLGSILASILFGIAGCGYRSLMPGTGDRQALAGEGAASGPVRIAVLAIRNDAPEPWLDRIVGEALRREVGLRGTLDLVNEPRAAELVVRGRIRPLDTRSNSFSSFVAALEYAVTMTLDLEVVRDGGTFVRLDPAVLSETELYLASADIEITRTRRLEALRHLADVLASRVVDAVELMESPIAFRPESGSESGGSQ